MTFAVPPWVNALLLLPQGEVLQWYATAYRIRSRNCSFGAERSGTLYHSLLLDPAVMRLRYGRSSPARSLKRQRYALPKMNKEAAFTACVKFHAIRAVSSTVCTQLYKHRRR